MSKYTYSEHKDGFKLLVEDAKFMYRPNFSGEVRSRYDRQGDRNFNIVIEDEELAQRLRDDGWNVRTKVFEDEEPINFINVKCKFTGYKDPKVYLVTGSKRRPVLLDEDSIGTIDSADIVDMNMTITSYYYEVNGKSGISAYLKTAYITIEEDEWADRYAEEEYPNE